MLLPKRLHQDFYNVYAFCRWSDDLGTDLAPSTVTAKSPDQKSSRTIAVGDRKIGPEHPPFV